MKTLMRAAWLAVCLTAWGSTRLVLYPGELAWVSEVRTYDVGEEGTLVLDLPHGTLAPSLVVEGLEVVSVQFATVNPPAIHLLVGQSVSVWVGDERIDGKLLAVDGGLTLATRDRLLFLATWDRVSGPLPRELPDKRLLRAQLRYRTTSPGRKDLVVRYLVQGIRWESSYTALFSGSVLHLMGWATVESQIPWRFADAGLTLVAGTVYQPKTGDVRVLALALPETMPSPAPAFEYYRYVLPGQWTLAPGVMLLPLVSVRVPFTRTYRFQGGMVEVYVKFKNETSPLPGGEIRFYEEGGALFVGAATLDNTPGGASVELAVGAAFDLRGERVQERRERLGDRSYREAWRITLTSAKEEEVEVEVVETLSGVWKIQEASLPYEVLSASQILFRVKVPAGGSGEVRYTVDWEY